MKVGLYFGSFNPVHIGHLAIANYIYEFSDLDKLWFVVSPQNPLKPRKSLLADYHRLELVNRAIEDDIRFRSCNIEFTMPKPSYTIDTLTYLSEKYPDYNYSLIMGSDSADNFHKWKNFNVILENYEVMVYPRPGCNTDLIEKYRMKIIEAPKMDISASFIRSSIKSGNDVRYFMPYKSWVYLDEMNFYK